MRVRSHPTSRKGAAVSTSPPLTRRRAQTRDKLIDAAIAVFGERGILAASVEEICERADFTRGAFYSNFGSMDDLVLALLKREGAAEMARAEQVINSITQAPDVGEKVSAETRIQMAVSALSRAQSDDRAKILVLRELRTYAVRNPQVRAGYLEFDGQCRREMAELVAGALGFVDLEFVLPAEQAIEIISSVFDHAIFESLLQQSKTESKADLDSSLDLLLPLLNAITRPIS